LEWPDIAYTFNLINADYETYFTFSNAGFATSSIK
jgi:hypothetical protein